MEIPRELRTAEADGDIAVRGHEYDDGSLVAVDFGPATGDLAVDTVGRTVIVVAGDEQVEFERPAEATDLTANGGVLILRS